MPRMRWIVSLGALLVWAQLAAAGEPLSPAGDCPCRAKCHAEPAYASRPAAAKRAATASTMPGTAIARKGPAGIRFGARWGPARCILAPPARLATAAVQPGKFASDRRQPLVDARLRHGDSRREAVTAIPKSRPGRIEAPRDFQIRFRFRGGIADK